MLSQCLFSASKQSPLFWSVSPNESQTFISSFTLFSILFEMFLKTHPSNIFRNYEHIYI